MNPVAPSSILRHIIVFLINRTNDVNWAYGNKGRASLTKLNQ